MTLTLVCCGLMLGLCAPEQAPAIRPPTVAIVDLSLDEAVARAVTNSEEVQLSEADVEAAQTRISAARAARLPQFGASTAYQRTFQSSFSSFGFQLSDEDRFDPDPNAPLEQRVRYLEENAGKAVLTTLSDLVGDALQQSGLGSPHIYSVNLNGSQLLYSFGRVGAGINVATHTREAARLTARESAAQVELDVRTAYYRALLAQELEAIAQAALVQAESFLNQERLRQRSGFRSDLDVLRAEVSLENLRPQLVDARNALALALLNVKRLTNIPMNQPIRLTTPLDVPTSLPTEPDVSPDALIAQRPAVQAAEEQIQAREQNIRLTEANYRPNVALQAALGGQIFPTSLVGFSDAGWRPNSSATVAVQLPLLSPQRGADVGQARVQLRQAELQATQLRESVQLQYEQAIGERERARATIAARQRTVEQAQRVYDLTVLRYEQGQATQLEISDARLALLQARTNLAQALSDFYVANAAVNRARGVTTVRKE